MFARLKELLFGQPEVPMTDERRDELLALADYDGQAEEFVWHTAGGEIRIKADSEAGRENGRAIAARNLLRKTDES